MYIFLKKWANLGLFFIYFCPSKHTLHFLQQINVKNAHPVSGARIQTHITTRPGLPPDVHFVVHQAINFLLIWSRQ